VLIQFRPFDNNLPLEFKILENTRTLSDFFSTPFDANIGSVKDKF
jgi:hypothetical protein